MPNGPFVARNGLIALDNTSITGSTDISGSLTVTGGITGSLAGTASWAVYAITASYALVAGSGGGGAAFPYTGSAEISGSLGVTGSFSINTNGQSSLFSTFYPAGTTGTNIYIGGGGQNGVFTGDGYDSSWNTSLGVYALQENTTGHGNIAMGKWSLWQNTSGRYNTSIGTVAMNDNTAGSDNTAVGAGALGANISGSKNNAIGSDAGYRLSSGAINTAPTNSIFIGYDSRAKANGETNQIVIGHEAIGLGSNTTVLGNSSTTHGRWYGNLLLGTNTNSGFLLDVNGTARVSNGMTVTGSLLVTDTITAQTLVVQTITSSVIFSSGSNVFGDALVDNQEFTGSVKITGSISLNGIALPTGTGSAGQVAYWSGTNTQAGSNNLFWDAANNRLGIGNNAPTNTLTLGAIPAASLQSTNNTLVSTRNTLSNIFAIIHSSNTFDERPIFAGIRTRGTITSPTSVQSGDWLTNLSSIGFDGTTQQLGAGLLFKVESAPSAGSVPQLFSILTGQNEATRTEKLQVRSNGNVIIQNGGTFTDGGQRLQVSGSATFFGNLTATTGSSQFLINHAITQPATTGSQIFGVNVTPSFGFRAPNQTQTAFRVNASFSGSSALTSSQANIIADFGAASVGSQFVVNDITSGSIYMVNDVSGLPIIEANSNWDVFMYDYPNVIFRKSGSTLELGVANNTGSTTIMRSDLVIDEGYRVVNRTTQVTGSTVGAVTSSLYALSFTTVSSSVYFRAIVTGYDTGSRDTITGDVMGTVRYRAGAASLVGVTMNTFNSDNAAVNFDIIAGGTSGSLVVYGAAATTYQWGATVTTQVI